MSESNSGKNLRHPAIRLCYRRVRLGMEELKKHILTRTRATLPWYTNDRRSIKFRNVQSPISARLEITHLSFGRGSRDQRINIIMPIYKYSGEIILIDHQIVYLFSLNLSQSLQLISAVTIKEKRVADRGKLFCSYLTHLKAGVETTSEDPRNFCSDFVNLQGRTCLTKLDSFAKQEQSYILK